MVLEVAEDSVPPEHIAIIMDGNNRWAKSHQLKGISGHKAGAERIRDILKGCEKLGVDTLTLFAFSSENWRRPTAEVKGLMMLFQNYLAKEAKELAEKGVRLKIIGGRDQYSKGLNKAIDQAEALTADGDRTLVLAADYGGQWDMAQAAKKIAEAAIRGEVDVDNIDAELMGRHICLSDLPPVDLLIRTGGDHRISNFLLWQIAYAELYFTECFWPDFDEQQLIAAVADYSLRQRRFGMTSEQVEGKQV
ncbi:MAG: di-trans,poly-cis-decaprenylcistransferase [Cellvibrionaceae bacterium]